jgi:hypothetical protein
MILPLFFDYFNLLHFCPFAQHIQTAHQLPFLPHYHHFSISNLSLITMSAFYNPTCPIFNAEIALVFLAIVTNPIYKKKAHPSQEKHISMLELVLNCLLPNLLPEKKLAYQSRRQFFHNEERLFPKPCSNYPLSRLVRFNDVVIDVEARVQMQHLHAEADTVHHHAAECYYGIKQDKIHLLLPFCLSCQDKKTAASAPALLKPIEFS